MRPGRNFPNWSRRRIYPKSLGYIGQDETVENSRTPSYGQWGNYPQSLGYGGRRTTVENSQTPTYGQWAAPSRPRHATTSMPRRTTPRRPTPHPRHKTSSQHPNKFGPQRGNNLLPIKKSGSRGEKQARTKPANTGRNNQVGGQGGAPVNKKRNTDDDDSWMDDYQQGYGDSGSEGEDIPPWILEDSHPARGGKDERERVNKSEKNAQKLGKARNTPVNKGRDHQVGGQRGAPVNKKRNADNGDSWVDPYQPGLGDSGSEGEEIPPWILKDSHPGRGGKDERERANKNERNAQKLGKEAPAKRGKNNGVLRSVKEKDVREEEGERVKRGFKNGSAQTRSTRFANAATKTSNSEDDQLSQGRRYPLRNRNIGTPDAKRGRKN